MAPGPLGEYDETRRNRPQNDTGSSLRSQLQHSATSRCATTTTATMNTSRQRSQRRERRADEAHSDGLRQQTTKHYAAINRMGRATRSVGGRIEMP